MSYYFRDKLSIKSNKIIANLFAQLILLSQKIQSFRQILTSVPYFDCIELFRVLDREQKGFLRLDDFQRLIGQDHKKIVTYAFSWFDQTKLGQVSRLQFISFLMPRRNSQLREITARRIQDPVDDDNFSTTINEQLSIFTQLLNEMISHELKIIQQRKTLLKQDDYSLKGVLNSLDTHCHQFVTSNDILKFLKNYAIEATIEQIQDLLEIVDSSLSGKINIDQLKWIIQGLESKQKDYLKKIKHSMKGKSSRKKVNSIRNSNVTQKQFVRTPQKSNQKFSQSKQSQKQKYYQSNQASQLQKSEEKENQYLRKQVFQSPNISKAKQITQKDKIKQSRNNKITEDYNLKFDSIVQRFKDAEREALRRDAQLIRAQLELKDRLRDELQLKSSQRRKRILTQTNTIQSQQRYKNEFPLYYPQKSIIDEFYDSRIKNRSISHNYDLNYAYQYPSASKYDKKINTIVENFYKRNSGSSSEMSRKYDTSSASFNNNSRQRSQSSMYNRSLYDRNPSYSNKFLEDQLHRIDRLRAFDQESYLIKNQIHKKLGSDILNVDFKSSHKKYDPLLHKAKQRPLEENIKKLKEKVQFKKDYVRQEASSPKMLENISIIDRNTSSLQNSAQKSSVKPYQERNSHKTEQKVRFADTPSSSSAYQSLANRQVYQKKQLHTTGTRYPGTQSKPFGTVVNYPKRQL